VLRISPDNGAAHHYLTHSYENLNQIDRALVHGEKYARTYDWHHVHNLDLLATAYEHKGQMHRAGELLREAAAVKPLTEYQEYNQKSLTVFLLGRERWKGALKTAKGLIGAKSPATRVVGHSFAGHAWLGLKDSAAAQRELEAAQREMNDVPTLVGGIAVARTSVAPYVDALRAEILLRDGKKEEGRALMKDVQARLRALPGPDAWTQALFRLDAFGRIARDVGDWDLAEHTARQMLEHDGAYGGSHLALALVARERGDLELARREAAEARKYWRDADKGLKEVKQSHL
jgi:tetratricopeptide (TPR) repeat protein